MKRNLIFTCLIVGVVCMLSACAMNRQSGSAADLSARYIDQQLKDAIAQVKVLATNVPDGRLPKTFEGDSSVSSSTSWWTSGFYPGTLLYLYEYSGDSSLWNLAEDKLVLLEKEKNNTSTHDLGFMLYCSFGNAMRITGDTANYKPILVQGAQSLISRYNPQTKTIRSWDHGSWTYPVIIDNMMNLEFLMEVSKLAGDSALSKIANQHAMTTMKNHFRPDYSSYHVIDYDPQTGEVKQKKTAQGAFDESSWARGQAWALYGYTMMYRETGNKIYLDFAQKIGDFILDHPNLPEDGIPYWDFDAPDLPEDSPYADKYKLYRDASAASIMASAFIELSDYSQDTHRQRYWDAASRMLHSLSEAPYKADYGSNGGFILKHSVGAIPLNSEVDVPLTYADYYYIEALLRYKAHL